MCHGTAAAACPKCIAIANRDRSTRIKMAVKEARSQPDSRRDKLSLQTIAAKYRIAKSTLHDHMSGKSKKFFRGRNRLFNAAQEETIKNELTAEIIKGIIMTDKEKRQFVFKVAEKHKMPHNFNQHTKQAGRKWFSSFTRRKLRKIPESKFIDHFETLDVQERGIYALIYALYKKINDNE